MTRFMIPCAAIACVFLALGCAAVQEGTDVVKYNNGEAPRTTETSRSGNYALYSSTDVSPKVTVFIEKGQTIGFQSDDRTGQLVAIGGKEKYPLSSNQNYYWKRL